MKKLLSVLALGLLCSCSSSVDFHMPSQRFLSPETAGGLLKGNGSIGRHASQKVVVLQNTNSNPVDQSSSINSAGGLALGGDLGLFKRLDFYARAFNDSPLMLGAKFQFLGDPDRTKPGIKVSVAAGYGSVEEEEKNDEFEIVNNEVESTVKADYTRVDYSAHIGYRFNEHFMLYFSAGKADYATEGEVFQGGNSVLKYKEEGDSIDYNLGGVISKKSISILLEAGRSESTWQDATDKARMRYGGVLRYHF